MKTTKTILLLTLLFLSISSVFSQNLEKLPEEKRNKLLIKEAKRTILKYGPGYWRDLEPKITLVTQYYMDIAIRAYRHHLTNPDFPHIEDCRWVEEAIKGRKWYYVDFPYDKTYESFFVNHSARVWIWSDTGKAFQIGFGNGSLIYLDKKREKGEKEPFVEYKKKAPLKRKSTNNGKITFQ